MHIDEAVAQIILTAKKQELAMAVSMIADKDQIIIKRSAPKLTASARRGSRYKGVSRNGEHWQVRVSI